MPDYPIDLGRKMEMPTAMSEKPSNEKNYPTVYLDWEKDYGFPDEGTVTFKFKKTGESSEKRNGKESYHVTLELRSIEDTEESDDSADKAKEESSADAVDRLKKEADDAAKDTSEGE